MIERWSPCRSISMDDRSTSSEQRITGGLIALLLLRATSRLRHLDHLPHHDRADHSSRPESWFACAALFASAAGDKKLAGHPA